MGTEKILDLLDQTEKSHRSRSLEKALSTAQEALNQATHEGFKEGIIRSNICLANIHNISYLYQGNKALLPKALDFVKTANSLKHGGKDGLDIQLLLSAGKVYENIPDYNKAEEQFTKAYNLSKENKFVDGQIFSLCSLSYLCVLKNDFSQALQFVNSAFALLEKTKPDDELLKIEVYDQLCKVYIKRQEFSNIEVYSKEILTISRKYDDVEKELSALNNIAIVHGVHSDYKTAMEYFLEALEKSKTINYRKSTAQCLINIGTIYAHLFNYNDALIRYQSVLEEYYDVLDNNRKVIIYNNVGNIYYSSNQTEQAIPYFKKALDLAEESNYREMTAHSLAQLSRSDAALKKFDEALPKAKKAKLLFDELGEINGKQINLIGLGDIYFNTGNYDEAIKLTSLGIVTAKRMKDDASEIRGYQLLATIYKELKDYEQALNYQIIYSTAQENFAKEQRNLQIIDLEIKYAIDEKQKQIEQLTKDNETQRLLLKQSDQIAEQNEKLLTANEDLQQFAYVASHDLKEPLRMIGSYTQLIQRYFADQINEDTEIYFDFVNEGVVRMNNLLDALLRYATIGVAEEEKELIDMNSIVEVCQMNLKLLIEETNTEIKWDDLPTVYGIQSLTNQLMQNLISNAIKFRKADVNPVIEIGYRSTIDEHIISVKDNGIGIDAEFKERIFVIFQRLHTRSKYEGTGIGLAICHKIMKCQGGRIWVASELGKGATFEFSFPKNKQ